MSDAGSRPLTSNTGAPPSGLTLTTQPGKDPQAQPVAMSTQAGKDPQVIAGPRQATAQTDASGKPIVPPPATGEQQTQQTGDQQQKPAPAAEGGDKPAEQQQQQLMPGSFEARAQKFTEEVTKTGTLSQESISAAAKEFGVTEDVVRTYIRNAAAQQQEQTAQQTQVQAQQQQAQNERVAYGVVGGEAEWANFAAWAKTTLNAQQLAAIDKANSNAWQDPITAQAVLGAAVSQWRSSGHGGGPRNLVQEAAAGNGAGGNAQGFGSQREMVKAMNDPRYRTDPTYVKEVEQKIVNSRFA